jgi:acyl-CoA hydrolase
LILAFLLEKDPAAAQVRSVRQKHQFQMPESGYHEPEVRGMTFDGSKEPAGKPAGDSEVLMARQMMPADANPWGYVHGGVVMKMVDEAAGSAAIRHARCRVATAAVDYMSFLHPVHVGDLLTLKASVNEVGRTSMEVGVRVETENMLTGERKHTSSAYVVMVALTEEGEPVEIPPVIPETPDQRRRMAAAKIRRTQRKILQTHLKQSADQLEQPAPVSSDLISMGTTREGE